MGSAAWCGCFAGSPTARRRSAPLLLSSRCNRGDFECERWSANTRGGGGADWRVLTGSKNRFEGGVSVGVGNFRGYSARSSQAGSTGLVGCVRECVWGFQEMPLEARLAFFAEARSDSACFAACPPPQHDATAFSQTLIFSRPVGAASSLPQSDSILQGDKRVCRHFGRCRGGGGCCHTHRVPAPTFPAWALMAGTCSARRRCSFPAAR